MSPEPRTVLLVDDEASVLEALRRTLKSEGYRILTAASGAEALAFLESQSVDILISDIEMPGMKGVELLTRVRDQWPDVIRIVLTGGGSLDSAIGAINKGEVQRYLTKPWSNEVLRETLRDMVTRLDELRALVRSEEPQARAQETLKRELEAQYPGILEVVTHKESGYVIDDERVGTILRGMDEVSRTRFRSSSLPSIGVTRVVAVEEP